MSGIGQAKYPEVPFFVLEKGSIACLSGVFLATLLNLPTSGRTTLSVCGSVL